MKGEKKEKSGNLGEMITEWYLLSGTVGEKLSSAFFRTSDIHHKEA